jgi:hypothetical protein
VFYQASHTTAKIGADNPNIYFNATIAPIARTVSGQRGSVRTRSAQSKPPRDQRHHGFGGRSPQMYFTATAA